MVCYRLMKGKPTANRSKGRGGPRGARSQPPRWRRRPEARRDEIAEAGLRLFARRGYLNVSVDDIAAAAGVTKGAVYHHFKGKDEMLVAAVDLHFRRTFEGAGAGAALAPGRPARECIEDLLWAGWQFWHTPDFQGLFRLVLGEGGGVVPSVRARFLKEGPYRGWKVLGGLIAAGQRAGEFRADLDPASAARLVASGLVLPIVLRSAAAARPPRARRADFDRHFRQVLLMLGADMR